MKYYAGHESTYQRLEAEGVSCWDRTAFDAFCMRPFLELALTRLPTPARGAQALDLGCGTGPATCVLAAHGYDALGVDLSPTAIRMARRTAAERNLAARFEQQDVLEMEGEACFDLVVDSHCLHCLVYDEDRRRLYATVLRLLKPGGAFVLETMSRHEGVRFDALFVLDDAGVLWRRYAGGDPADTRVIDGEAHHPNRRILPPEALDAELRDAGFVLDWVRTEPEENPGEPRNFQAIARVKTP
jgi:SAM-dependent methyltransferase